MFVGEGGVYMCDTQYIYLVFTCTLTSYYDLCGLVIINFGPLWQYIICRHSVWSRVQV